MGFQDSRRHANVIDASAMAATINGTTAPAKGAMSATRKMARRLRRSPRAANWIGATRQHGHDPVPTCISGRL